jgi:hypothetical protein
VALVRCLKSEPLFDLRLSVALDHCQSPFVECNDSASAPGLVPTDPTWQPLVTDADQPVINQDTLTALIAADPQTMDTPRHLSEEAYNGAFDAWEIARHDTHQEWKHLADGTYLQPDVPKALRTASELLYKNPDALEPDNQEDLLLRLNTAPSNRVVTGVREILNSEQAATHKLEAIHELLVDSGVQPATAPPNIKQIEPDEIRLVCWMAVQGSKQMTADLTGEASE